MTDTSFIKTRNQVEKESHHPQNRNRLWWEEMPMTYADWEEEERLPVDDESFVQIEDLLIGASPFLRTVFDFSKVDGKRVLDLGCGSGVLSCKLAKNGAKVTAVDLTNTATQMAQKNARAQKVKIDIARSDAESLTFSDNSFDYIMSWGVLHHTSNMSAAIGEVGRVLKSGGNGLIMVYYRPSIAYYVHGLAWLIFKGKIFQGYTLKTVQDVYTDGYQHRYLNKSEMAKMLSDSGLELGNFTVTQYENKILPFIPVWLDNFLKARFGMCLISEFTKSVD